MRHAELFATVGHLQAGKAPTILFDPREEESVTGIPWEEFEKIRLRRQGGEKKDGGGFRTGDRRVKRECSAYFPRKLAALTRWHAGEFRLDTRA